ncbi:MAG: response regulator transcription factor [Myxococcales bacterium]|nr:response regulator transcription factor [Myxococcales bacterium]
MGGRSASAIRVAIVEDDDTTREALAILLAGEEGVEVTGRFARGGDVLGELQSLDATVMLVDLGLPDMSGDALIAEVKAHRPALEVMAYTVSESRAGVFAALRAGATGYILKGCSPRELVEALRTLADGGAPMSPSVARMVVRTFQDEDAVAEDYLLTARERDVLRHLEHGLSYKEVASALSISPHTVHSHIKKVYDKLHARGRGDAVNIARMKGLL